MAYARFCNSKNETGNSSVQQNYEYTDQDPLPGINYYRLKQTDFDGSFAYSRVQFVNFGDVQPLALYPNPVADKLLLKNVQKEKVDRVRILNLTGQALINTATIPADGIDVSSLSAGIYIVDIKMRDGSHTRNKIVIGR